MQIRLPKDVLIPTAVGLMALGVGLGVGYAIGKNVGRKIHTFVPDSKRVIKNDEVFTKHSETEEKEPQLSLFDTRRNDSAPEQASSGDRETEGRTRLLMDVVENSFASDAREETEDQEVGRVDNSDELDPRQIEGDVWYYEVELERRQGNPGRPYVIHYDEFRANESDYPQESLTYFGGDMVLVHDGEDKEVQNPTKIVGNAVDLFGHGSLDPNIVYVRNDKIGCEYEVKFDPGHYLIEVLGAEPEIRHSAKWKKKDKEQLPKFRLD